MLLFLGVVLMVIAGFYVYSHKHEQKKMSAYGIQFTWDCAGAKQLREAIKPIANNIIQEELGLAKDKMLFLGKDHQVLTIFYVDDMMKRDENILFSMLERMIHAQQLRPPMHLSLAAQIDFFGENSDEFVVFVDDHHHELAKLNRKMKTIIHALDDQYLREHHTHFFNRVKSEQFSYVPHIGLGRIRINSIKKHIKDTAQIDVTLKRIKDRIIQATLHEMGKILVHENKKITCKKVSIGSFGQGRAQVKEYQLEHVKK